MLGAGEPERLEDGRLVLGVRGPIRGVFEQRREEIESLLRQAAGRRISLDLRDPDPPAAEHAEALPPSPLELARAHPLVRRMMEVFDARIENATLRTRS